MKAMSLEELTKEQLEELVRIYARNLLALDGVWFQSVERGRGMDEAMAHDCAVWRRFTETEARRIKTFLGVRDGHQRSRGVRRPVRDREEGVNLVHIQRSAEGRALFFAFRCWKKLDNTAIIPLKRSWKG